jgi:hypothetical protein
MLLEQPFFYFVVTSGLTLTVVLFQYCYQVKCKEISICWNCLTINRDIDVEHQMDVVNITNPNTISNRLSRRDTMLELQNIYPTPTNTV